MPLLFSYNIKTSDADLDILKPIEIPSWIPTKCKPYWEEVTKYDWDATTTIKVMYAESGCNSQAKNMQDSHKTCKGSFGLMQISCGYKDLHNPVQNIKIAYEEKYSKGGWSHWSVCRSIVNCKKTS